MDMRRTWIGGLACLVIVAACGTAQAQSSLQRRLFRMAEFGGDRDFISSPQRGPLFDNNLFAQRVEWNRLGGGYTIDQFRFFGTDSYDNPNTFDFGALKIQLTRDPTLSNSPQPVGMHNRFGYTTTLIPEIFFSTRTGQRNFDIFSGQTSFAAAPINYIVELNTGAQNFRYDGNILIDTSTKINMFGFYDVQGRITNIGNATSEGMLLEDEKVTDFDTGDMHLTGNIFTDLAASFFQAGGQPLFGAPLRIFSGGAAKDKKTDSLLARIREGETLNDDDMQYLLHQMIVTAFQNDPIGFLLNGMPSSVPGFEGLSLAGAESAAVDPAYLTTSQQGTQEVGQVSADQLTGATNAPEPGTLILLLIVTSAAAGIRSLERRLAW
jgi:hypothetical protein